MKGDRVMIDPIPLYRTMYQHMGPQHWWPADTKIEIVIGAILVQNTNWNNADLALENLRRTTSLDVKRILALSVTEVQDLVRPSGFYVNKTKSLLSVLSWFNEHHCHFEQMVIDYGRSLRQRLLKLPGIGEETADSLLVYVFDQPIFIADKYARKLFSFLGYQNVEKYDTLKKQVRLPQNFTYQDAQEFHGLIDEFGKRYLKNRSQFDTSFLAPNKPAHLNEKNKTRKK
ncbi:HhH-GPD family protein [Lentilactobacillus diolivorans DSM 14421]|uniref:HhH-GPD family protein n=2 Tax=Lentilactobacillus diolivorans TaxID=179838 RepID=A0A0R1SAD2_9LACO|nr:HhH-GPD family protein [Lentilactobacillus diolivorans DSM 14421]